MSVCRIGVVDDETDEVENLRTQIVRYFSQTDETCDVEVFDSGISFIEKFTPKYDCIFLDVQMKPLDGMATAKEIRLRDEKVLLVFVTHFDKFAVMGYEVGAFDYIIKPVRYRDFECKLTRIMRALKKNRSRYIYLKIEREMLKVDEDDIEYIEVSNHYLKYHLTDRSYEMKKTLKAAEEELGDSFIKCNSCFLVNMKHIKAYKDGAFMMTCGDSVLISRKRKKECLKAFAGYIGGR